MYPICRSGVLAGMLLFFVTAVHAQIPLISCKLSSEVSAVAFAPNGKMLATGSADSKLRLWDGTTYKERQQMTVQPGSVTAVLFSRDSGMVIAGTTEGAVNTYEVGNGNAKMSMRSGRGTSTVLAMAPDGVTLASGGQQQRIFIRNVNNGGFTRVIQGTNNALTGMAYAPNGQQLAVADLGRQVTIWEMTTGQQVRTLRADQDGVHGAAFSPDGKNLIAGGKNGVLFWNVASGKQLPSSAGHKGAVLAVAYSPNGKMAASAGEDGNIVLWDSASAKPLRVVGKHTGAALCLAFAPSGKTLASGGRDQTLQIWDVSARIFTPAKPVQLTDDSFKTIWDQLAGSNFAQASEAMGTLLAAPQQTVVYLDKQMREVRPDESEKRIAQLIARLDDDNFNVREKASLDLERLGPAAVIPLQQTLKNEITLEVRTRTERILRKLKTPEPTPDQLRLQRAIAVLEMLGSPEARKLLEELGRGSSGAWLASEAKATLERLASKNK